MALPESEFDLLDVEIIDEVDLPTKTWNLDFDRGEATSFVEGKDAVKQAMVLSLTTTRFEHIIYSEDYGFEDMIGKERLFIEADLPRRIEETLLQDDRIESVESIELYFEKDVCSGDITARTVYGDVTLYKLNIMDNIK